MIPDPPVYRRSIWSHDESYDLRIASLSPNDLAAISRLASVEAAKKRIQPIPASSLLAISRSARSMPAARDATEGQLKAYLVEGMKHKGAGVITLICMLAVETDGDYSPIDRKVAAGLLREGRISKDERICLLSSRVEGFATTYLTKVIPAWHESRKDKTPVEADSFWGGAGQDFGEP